jgi:hypothetical protein
MRTYVDVGGRRLPLSNRTMGIPATADLPGEP